MSNIVPCLPYYCKPPNKFIRYYQKRFEGEHHSATLNIFPVCVYPDEPFHIYVQLYYYYFLYLNYSKWNTFPGSLRLIPAGL